MKRIQNMGLLILAAAIPLIAVLPLPDFWITQLNYIGMYSMTVMGLVLLTGVGGLTSFGQAAFVGFILAFYGTRTASGDYAGWNDKPLIDGYVAGDQTGNVVFAAHVLLASVVTLAGLIQNHGVDPEDFLDEVHDVSLDLLTPDPQLIAAVERLPGRRLIFTNADADYAARVLDARGIADLFDGICDIRITRYTPKPDPAAYATMIAHLGVDPAKSLFVEDMARNLTPAKALGMTTVWLDNGSESGHRDHLPDQVDFHVSDLADWLDSLPAPWGIS